jgi:chromosome partitioning protein
MRVIVVGNEKGGSGKSTTAAHLALGLQQLGKRVATFDIDTRQQTLTRFLSNRSIYAGKHELALLVPEHRLLVPSNFDSVTEAKRESEARFDEAVAELEDQADYLVIDSPGSDTSLSRYAHSHADVLVTPVNDSFVDLDVLVDIDAETFRAMRPSRYCVMVWEQKKRRAARDGGGIEWLVVRNRLAHLDARNKRRVAAALETLGPRVGFRSAPGFSERVIYRELFPRGLTVLDVGVAGMKMTMSHIGARNEVRQLLALVLQGLAASQRDSGAGETQTPGLVADRSNL